MRLYPKKDYKNVFGGTIWYKDQVYECSQLSEGEGTLKSYYIVTCELIGNEYPILEMSEILDKFYLESDIRDKKINNFLE